MLTPLKFRAVYKDNLWGGQRLKAYGKIDPAGKRIAESWEIAHHPNGESVVREGPLKGLGLGELLKKYGRDLIGSLAREEDLRKFPLLIKFIDAKQNLSVQVHPNDEQAARLRPGEYGKNEMWYIVESPEEGTLIAGVRDGVTREHFARSIEEGRCEACLNYVPVRSGEALNIPAGLIHAITAGALVYEVQQNSDTTFRVYDYRRRDDQGNLRELHVAEALEVSRFDGAKQAVFPGLDMGDESRLLVMNRYFDVRSLEITDSLELAPAGRSFHILTLVEGALNLRFAGGEVRVERGETVLIPAALERYVLQADDKAKAILSRLPEIEDIKKADAIARAQSKDLAQSVGLEPSAEFRPLRRTPAASLGNTAVADRKYSETPPL